MTRTHLYTIDLPKKDLDLGLSRMPVEHQGSGYTRGGSFIQFRAEDDEAASEIAREVGAGLEFGLRNGLGVNHRSILGTDRMNPRM